MEILTEAALGKKFPIQMSKNGATTTLIGIASANAKPGERPYRITWFKPDLSKNLHTDLEIEELVQVLKSGHFSPEIIDRIKKKWPEGELLGDAFTFEPIVI